MRPKGSTLTLLNLTPSCCDPTIYEIYNGRFFAGRVRVEIIESKAGPTARNVQKEGET